MVKKTVKKTRVRTSSTKRPLKSSRGMASSLVEAAIEIGRAAESLKESYGHVKKVGSNGVRAMKPMRQAGKNAVKAVRNAIHGKR